MPRPRWIRLGVLLALPAATSLLPRETAASGFYLMDVGARPLGRGGAFVAGADDLYSIWYNPAGLAWAGRGVLLDAGLALYRNTFTRTAQPDPGGAPVTFRPVSTDSPPYPLPTLAVSHDFGLPHTNFALGVVVPHAAVPSFPDTRDSPQRYTVISFNGSAFALVGLWASHRFHPTFAVGLGLQALVGTFVTRFAFSSCPATILCATENPDWDSIAEFRVGPFISPTGSIGVRWLPHPMVAVGASFQLPVWVDSSATLAVRLPGASFWDGASTQGDQAQVRLDLAPIARVGIELRPLPNLRVEVAGVWEGWRMHDRIDLVPVGVQLMNVRATGTYDIGPIVMQRGFQDTFSVRLGGELDLGLGAGWRMAVRAGAAFETSATPTGYTSVLTMDSDKIMGSLGLGFARGRLRLHVTYAHLFASSVTVLPSEGQLFQSSPTRSNLQAPTDVINAGHYDLSVDTFGLALQYGF